MIERQLISLDMMTVDFEGDDWVKVTDSMFAFVSYMKEERPSLQQETNVLERYNQKKDFLGPLLFGLYPNRLFTFGQSRIGLQSHLDYT